MGEKFNIPQKPIEIPEKTRLDQKIKKRSSKGPIKKIGRFILGEGYIYLIVEVEDGPKKQTIKNILPHNGKAKKLKRINDTFVDRVYKIKNDLYNQKKRALVVGVPSEGIHDIYFEQPPFYKIQCSNDAGAGDKRHTGRVKDLEGNTVYEIDDDNDSLIDFVRQAYDMSCLQGENIVSQYENIINDQKGIFQKTHLAKLNSAERWDFVNHFLIHHSISSPKERKCKYFQKTIYIKKPEGNPISIKDDEEEPTSINEDEEKEKNKIYEIYRVTETESGEKHTYIGYAPTTTIAEEAIRFLKEED